MSFYTDTIDYLVRRMSSIEDIGIVHGYFRYTKEMGPLYAMCVAPDKKFQVWMITRDAVPVRTTGGSVYYRDHRFLMLAYYGVQDAQASEIDLGKHVDLVCECFGNDHTLGSIAEASTPVAVGRFKHVRFAGVVCHHVELSLTVTEARSRIS